MNLNRQAAAKMTAIENKLYGTDSASAEMPDPDDLIALLA